VRACRPSGVGSRAEVIRRNSEEGESECECGWDGDDMGNAPEWSWTVDMPWLLPSRSEIESRGSPIAGLATGNVGSMKQEGTSWKNRDGCPVEGC
jgi:hypothetical protein